MARGGMIFTGGLLLQLHILDVKLSAQNLQLSWIGSSNVQFLMLVLLRCGTGGRGDRPTNRARDRSDLKCPPRCSFHEVLRVLVLAKRYFGFNAKNAASARLQ